jgi:sugar phosphate isomerase/epimerase
MERRRFLIALGTILAASGGRTAEAARLTRIGLHMGMLGEEARGDATTALQMVAGLGYREVEVWTPDGATLDVPRLRAALDRQGLTAPSRHVRMPDLFSNARRILAECRILGTRHVVCAEVPAEQRASLDGYARIAQLLNSAGKLTGSVGIQLSLHPHREDFTARNGMVPFDFLLRNTDPGLVKLQMDPVLMTLAGRNPVSELAGGRYVTLHVNDLADAPGQAQVTLGDGRIDLPALLAAAASRAAVQHYFVDDERTGSPWERIKADFAYLSQLEF